jgi:hypothetical protein
MKRLIMMLLTSTKPIAIDRFNASVKSYELYQLKSDTKEEGEHIFIKSNLKN